MNAKELITIGSQWNRMTKAVAVAANCLLLAGAARGDFSDTYTRPDNTLLGTTETGGLTYQELDTTGGVPTPAEVANVQSGGLRLPGGVGNNPAGVRLAGAGYDLDVSATVRFLSDNYNPAQVGNDVVFFFRQNHTAGTMFSKGAVQLDILANGSYRLFAWHQDSPGGANPANLTGGFIPIGSTFLVTDADQDGVLESNEPFTVRMVVSGTSFRWYMNGERIACFTLPSTEVDEALASSLVVGRNRSLSAPELEIGFDNLFGVAPSALNVTIAEPASGTAFPVNVPVSFSGTFTDANGGSYAATWTIDGLNYQGSVTSDGDSGTVIDSFSFNAPGVYAVALTLIGDCGSSGSTELVGDLPAFVVIYDPSAGFVTGGGWIDSPAGAYADDLSLSGKATFGFVSQYKKGATVPTGATEFQFKAGGLHFKSSRYDWLVVSGARAQYKGSGSINGAGDYGFILTTVDGQFTGGGGTDKFRVKIWDNLTGDVVYDNQMGVDDAAAPATTLGGGSIVIHKQ